MRIGVIFCSCSGQIEQNLIFKDLKELILKDVEWIYKVELACSEENKKDLEILLKNKKPEALVIFSCSPHNKGSFFLQIAKDSGINPYMVNIINAREQIAWVTKDKEKATHKAYTIFKGTLERLKKQKPLFDLAISMSQDILIVGGGISGIYAAVTLSKAGKKVYLIEKESFLGGKIVRYEKLFPDLSCGPCFVNPLVEEVLNSNIDLRLNSEVKELKGYFGNVYATVLQKPTYVNPRKCIGCSACEDVCPLGAIKVKSMSLPVIASIDAEKCARFRGENCDFCIKECPVNGAINFEEKEREEKLNVGAVLWATGFKLLDCKIFSKLGYGKLKDIYNSLEFEDLLNIEGPCKGEIITNRGKIPDTIAIIHCVGSLDKKYKPYCSKICCQYAFKFNRILRQNLPEIKIIHFVKEIVLPGEKAYESYFMALKDPMVKIIRYENLEDLSVRGDDFITIKHGNETYNTDVIVLCPAIISGDRKFNAYSGVFPVGSAKEAMSIQESITDSLAVCGKILSEINDRIVIKSPTVAKIDYNKCTNCGICIIQCPYIAIEFDMKKPKLIETLCEGCGVCVVSCPAKAIDLEGFTSEQIVSEIKGILNAFKEG